MAGGCAHALGTIAGDAVSDNADLAELLDIDMDQFSGVLALVTADRFGRFQSAEFVKPQASQDAADTGRRDVQFGGDLLAGVALTAQALDLLDNRLRRRPMRPGGSIPQSRQALAAIEQPTYALSAGRPQPLPLPPPVPARSLSAAQFAPDMRRQTGILVHVHPVLLLGNLSFDNSNFLGQDRMGNLLKAHR